MRKHELYKVWLGMRNRCHNRNAGDFHRYGGRGIYIAARWHDFANFLSDMGERPSPVHTVERIDNDGPYSWWNCRWATRVEQARNKETNRHIVFDGRDLILSDWADEFGINPSSLYESIEKHGEASAMDRASRRLVRS